MFSDDEDELELLRQYGDRDLHGDEDEGHSSDDLDSDLEDKIMSMVQFNKKTPVTEKQEEPKVVYAPVEKEDTKPTQFSASNELQISDDDSDTEDIGVLENPPTPQHEEELPVTRYINFDDDKQYMDEQETDEEEAELNSKLQDLIDEQISMRQSTMRLTRPIRVCFGCHQPGHERKDCKLCADCGAKRHADSRCVGARYCGKCKMRGHNQIDCPNPREPRPCQICQTPYHNALNCPSILHVYENEGPVRKKPTAYCYYCTEKGHYGDECSMLPKYLTTMPSAFSYLSLSEGNRFDPKKTMKGGSGGGGGGGGGGGTYGFSNSHQRWSDQSRESSPRDDDRRGGYKRRFDDYQDRGDYHNNKKKRYDDNNDRYNNKKNYKPSSYKDNNAGGKRHRTDLVEENTRNGLDYIFVEEKKKNNYNYSGKSGNNNWKAVNSSLPQPTRSGTVNLNKKRQQQEQQQYGDFPRGNNDLPRPSSSGVIDLTQNDNNNNNNNGSYSKRTPKYHGGYNRR